MIQAILRLFRRSPAFVTTQEVDDAFYAEAFAVRDGFDVWA